MTAAPDILFVVLLALLLAGMLSIVVSSLMLGISPMPTSRQVRGALLRLVPPQLEGTLLELGAGWGTLAFPLAERCPRATVLAFELSPIPFAFTWLRQRLSPRKNLKLLPRDFFDASFEGASLVVCYLYPGAMERLAPKLARELAPSARVLTHTFALRGWTPRETLTLADFYRTPIYVYEVPAAKLPSGPGGL